jgi:hypothetical protein
MADTTQTATETARQAADTIGRTAGRVRDRLDLTDRRVRDFVQEYPLTSFFTAVAAGYLVARLANRI